MVIRRFLRSFFNGSDGPEASESQRRQLGNPQSSAFSAAAQQLERQCQLLKRTGTDLAAVWGGEGVVPPPSGPYRHWISVSSRYLPSEFGSAGVLSVYTNEEDCISGIAVFSPNAALIKGKGEYLYAHMTPSLPPPDASPDLQNKAYTDQWTHNCPIYSDKDVVAVLGGWHFPWPDDDWEELRDRDLLVWTIEGSEPWVEVWSSNAVTSVMQRIT